MKRILLLLAAAFMFGTVMPTMAQQNNHFFLSQFTHTGFSSYDWHFEPLKTDKDRGNLKGNVYKVVTTVIDEDNQHLTDTMYFNAKGNITKIVSSGETIKYVYDENDVLKEYTSLSAAERRDGIDYRKGIHTMEQDKNGHIIKDFDRVYSKKGNSWEEWTPGDPLRWTFVYDANGNLVSGVDNLQRMNLTYKNGQLVKAQNGKSKPVAYTYDAAGRLTSLKYFMIDGMDETYYNEFLYTLTYNERGDIIKAVKGGWDCNSKWQRRRAYPSEIFTIAYTYDEKGNWTKAVAYSKWGKDPRRLIYTINRTITYGLPVAAHGGRPQQVIDDNNEKVYDVVDQMPAFPGGVSGLVDYLSQNVHYPDLARVNNIQGRVMVKFVVEKDGSINECKIVKSVDPSLDKEALRVVKSMPKWQPGMKDGKPVRVSYTVPISFKL